MGVLVVRFILICSLFNALVCCLSSLHLNIPLPTGNETDRLALLAIKAQIKQDPHKIMSSWNDSIHFCLWQGVICSLKHHQRVTVLDLKSQTLVGPISPQIGNLTFLRELHLQNNSFTHEIPSQIGHLHRLQVLLLDHNLLSGPIPANISNCFNLINLNVGHNNLEGKIPPEIVTLSKLQKLVLQVNNLIGEIPPSLGNLSSLKVFSAKDNTLSGGVPPSIYNLSALVAFSLSGNQIHWHIPSYLGNTLPNLQYFYIDGNQFTGSIPLSISNLTSLVEFDVSQNKLTGQVPNLQNLVNLKILSMGNNHFTGDIPTEIGKLSRLGRLGLQNNVLSGSIPSSLGNLAMLTTLLLQGNKLEGSIPSSLEQCQRLRLLNLSQNNLNGTIPPQVIGLPLLSISLDLSRNNFVGPLPLEVGQLKSLAALDISDNRLSGELPRSLGGCVSLQVLKLQGNFFQGHIPSSLISLKGIQDLDLSRNHLSGEIPQFLEGFGLLKNLNLSFNQFSGALPVDGVFNNATATSIVGNKRLCSNVANFQLPKCISEESKGGGLSPSLILIISISGCLAIAMVLSFQFLLPLRKKIKSKEAEMKTLANSILQLSYSNLLNATDGFSPTTLIGVGSFGSVYKGVLLLGDDDDDRAQLVAVKVLNLLRRGACKSFMAECEALRNIRHRNLVKIITTCSSVDFGGNDFKALVYEFMDNGSLEEWLHPPTGTEELRGVAKNLNLVQRLDIAIDVACALDYLHNQCGTPIVHCDLKPSNVLLDNELTAHVSDFGLARFLSKLSSNISANQTSSIGIRGSVGYAAPEYGMGSKVTTYGDVYSFGILLLEMFTGKRPTDNMFSDDLNLHNFVKVALPERVTEVADSLLVHGGNDARRRANDTQKQLECLCLIFRIGIASSVESPRDRKRISDVASELHSIRDILVR